MNAIKKIEKTTVSKSRKDLSPSLSALIRLFNGPKFSTFGFDYKKALNRKENWDKQQP